MFLPKVKAKDDFREGVLVTLSLMADAVSTAVVLAEEILSLATCVIGAAFLGHVLLYHDDLFGVPSCLVGLEGPGGLTAGWDVLAALGDCASWVLAGDSFCRLGVRSFGAIWVLLHV